MAKILIVDDEADILHSIEAVLTEQNYDVAKAMDGNLALELFRKFEPDLIVLDIMLPGLNGYEVCKKIRELNSNVIILMLTAKVSENDAVQGLETGANDYIQKPVRLQELIARIKAHLKNKLPKDNKQKEELKQIVINESLTIDIDSHSVILDDKEISLTQREFELLLKLAQNKNRVFSREQLLEEVWGWSFSGESRTVDVHIRYLREKLEQDATNPQLIKTVRGIGYKIAV